MKEEKLSDKIDKTNDLLQKLIEGESKGNYKENKFRLPRGIKGKVKKGKVLVIMMRNNNTFDFKLLPVIDETIYFKDSDNFYLGQTKYIGMTKNKLYPVIMLTEWSVEPITKQVLINATKNRKTSISVQKHIIKLMEGTADTSPKEKKSMRGIIVIGLILIGAYLILKQIGAI